MGLRYTLGEWIYCSILFYSIQYIERQEKHMLDALKMLLYCIKHQFIFGKPAQAVNRDDLDAENVIKDRTG